MTPTTVPLADLLARVPDGVGIDMPGPEGGWAVAVIDGRVYRARVGAVPCECFVTPESEWLSAASCGYGSGYEPGSQVEPNPECPVHGEAVEES